jgi:hypothetical protein
MQLRALHRKQPQGTATGQVAKRNQYATDKAFSLIGQTQEALETLVDRLSAGIPRREHEVRYGYLGSR